MFSLAILIVVTFLCGCFCAYFQSKGGGLLALAIFAIFVVLPIRGVYSPETNRWIVDRVPVILSCWIVGVFMAAFLRWREWSRRIKEVERLEKILSQR